MTPMKHKLELTGLAQGWSGYVLMIAPRSTDRIRAISEGKFHKIKNTKDAGKDSEKKLEILFEQQLPALIDLYEKKCRPLIEEVRIVGPEGQVIEDLEVFDRHEACEQCFAEVAAAYLEGFGPKKGTKPRS